ncbi:MAG: Asp-tRNA(Asn)/Glu-tRNA(Gln) amidotransferase subunit GatC [Archangium sp.]|nr:Asp-tRNA(Asn)/Glu-tRNA(Gln) amidotransferase subunit GatC [Archangium sp.]
MKLELEQVRHVAKLARLSLTSDEETRFATQLSAVLDAVEALSAVDTDGVPPTTFAIASATHARPDEVRDELPADVALANAPQKEGSSFAIPRVIE